MPVLEDDRLTVRHMTLLEKTDILLAVTHFPSKIHHRDESQTVESTRLSALIRESEKLVGHSRTVLVGDLNMNPFEAGIVSAGGLNAVMSQSIARRQTRIVQKQEYPFFYNPMWGLFGDMTPGPAGTYYYDKAEHKTFYWNMFDQVLIRPGLLDSFQHETLKIIESGDDIPFLSSTGLPNGKIASDHLPILFEMNL